jgi:hypothetical protein
MIQLLQILLLFFLGA